MKITPKKTISYISNPEETQVIAPSFGKRFSGINASMLAVIPEQTKLINIVAMGFHIDGKGVLKLSLRQFFRHCWRDKWRIWHARRNIDMLVGLILRHLLKFKLILLFTSAAQRKHTWVTRFYYRRMEEIITPTAASAAFLERESTVVPHGVNIDKFYPPENRHNEWRKKNLPGKSGFGIIGRIRPNKGTREFVEAAIQVLRKRPDWTAVVIGKATAEQAVFLRELRAMIKVENLEDRIIFTGFQTEDQIAEWYRSLSIVVCASHVEGFGLPCLEAMASACPVIATHTGAWPEVISNGNDGFLIPTNSSKHLAEKLEILTADPERILNMGREARKKMERKYNIQSEAKGIQLVYERMFEKRGGLDNSDHRLS